MSSNLNIVSTIPAEYENESSILSGMSYILDRRVVQIPSSINGQFSYSTNDRIEFQISSPNEFAALKDGVFECNLTTTLLNDGDNVSTRYLSEGGLNALIREVRIETQSGVLLQRIERYNKFYATMSAVLHPREHVDSHLAPSGDSVSPEEMRTIAANTDGILLQTRLMVPILQMDDIFPLMFIPGGIKIVLVLERPEHCIVAGENPEGTGFSNCGYTISNAKFTVPMSKPSESLVAKYLAEFKSSKGLQYTFPDYSHSMNLIPSGSSGTQSLQVSTQTRSLKHLLCFIQNSRAETVSAGNVDGGISTYTADSVAQKLKANLDQFSVNIGSKNYPFSQPMDTTSPINSGLLTELQKVFDLTRDVAYTHRFTPVQYMSFPSNENSLEMGQTAALAESQRLVIGCNLEYDSSDWSGLNVQGHQVILRPSFSQAYQMTNMAGSAQGVSPLYLHTFLCGDRAMVLQQDSGVTMFN